MLTANEQLMLELINRARADPSAEAARYGIGLNDGVPASDTISTAPKQPLAFSAELVDAARLHSQDMETRDFFSHDTPDGRDLSDRVTAAGWDFGTSGWALGENIAYSVTTAGVLDGADTILSHHEGLFRSSGHRENTLSARFSEVGVGQALGDFVTSGGRYWPHSSHVTVKFADAGRSHVTGVVIADADGDDFYDVGEGLGGVEVRVTGTGGTFVTTTLASGGYAVAVPDGSYQVTFSGGGIGNDVTETVVVSGTNVKVDAQASGAPSGDLTRIGTASADLLEGAAGDDSLYGAGGRDTLTGGMGRDTLDGGAGSDRADYSGSPDGVSVNLAAGRGRGAEAAGDRYASIEHVTGSSHRDAVWGDGAANAIFGLAGNDVVRAFAGSDTINGGSGDDRIDGGRGGDVVNGGGGDDTLLFDRSDAGVVVDLLAGSGSGGDAAGDTYARVEHVVASVHDDAVSGAAGTNVIQGLAGNDTLIGGDGDDYLYGQAGRDRLEGGDGDDKLKGNQGADVYVFDGDDGFDAVRSFQRSVDRIELEGGGFEDVAITSKSWGTRIDFENTTIALVNVTGAITEDHFV